MGGTHFDGNVGGTYCGVATSLGRVAELTCQSPVESPLGADSSCVLERFLFMAQSTRLMDH
jgi:hypothetical protein